MNGSSFAPDIFTADYVGKPGERTFYLQARAVSSAHTYVAEKQQISVLAEKLKELLLMVDSNDTVGSAVPERDPALAITEPVEPEARLGAIGLAFEEAEDAVIVFLQPADDAEVEEAEDDTGEEEFELRINLRRDQARSFVLHVAAIVSEGRPTCQLCGLPMDPEGHRCPASNGHRLGS